MLRFNIDSIRDIVKNHPDFGSSQLKKTIRKYHSLLTSKGFVGDLKDIGEANTYDLKSGTYKHFAFSEVISKNEKWLGIIRDYENHYSFYTWVETSDTFETLLGTRTHTYSTLHIFSVYFTREFRNAIDDVEGDDFFYENAYTYINKVVEILCKLVGKEELHTLRNFKFWGKDLFPNSDKVKISSAVSNHSINSLDTLSTLYSCLGDLVSVLIGEFELKELMSPYIGKPKTPLKLGKQVTEIVINKPSEYYPEGHVTFKCQNGGEVLPEDVVRFYWDEIQTWLKAQT